MTAPCVLRGNDTLQLWLGGSGERTCNAPPGDKPKLQTEYEKSVSPITVSSGRKLQIS